MFELLGGKIKVDVPRRRKHVVILARNARMVIIHVRRNGAESIKAWSMRRSRSCSDTGMLPSPRLPKSRSLRRDACVSIATT